MIPAVVLRIRESRYAIPLPRVIEIAPRVHVVPLPGVAAPVLGYVGYRGQPVPVVDLRLRLSGAAEALLEDHLVIARTSRRPVALVVDRVEGIVSLDPAAAVPPPESALAVAGVLALEDGLLLIADLDRVLSLEEERAVGEALAEVGG